MTIGGIVTDIGHCEDCRYFDRSRRIAECHRHAPVAPAINPSESAGRPAALTESHWPQVASDDWCGEFCPAPMLADAPVTPGTDLKAQEGMTMDDLYVQLLCLATLLAWGAAFIVIACGLCG